MDAVKDPFSVLVVEEETDDFAILTRKSVAATSAVANVLPGVVTGCLQGFDLDDQPLIVGLPDCAGEVVSARTIVPLARRQIGSTVVVLFEQHDVRRPIIVGVLQEPRPVAHIPADVPEVSITADDDRMVLRAEREITLRCGDASITLTRAGKVIIKGSYVISRSSGYNKIKGAAVEIN